MKYFLIIILILIIIFASLFFQRSKEIVLVRKTVDDFIFSINKKENYRQYLQDNFIKIFEEDIYNKASNLFESSIASIDEGTGEYKVSTETGKTFIYTTNINYSHGDKAVLIVKLIKNEDKWSIYGLSIETIVSDEDKKEVKQTVDGLFQSIKDNSDYSVYLNPKFTDIFKTELLDKFPDNFIKGEFSNVYTVGKFKDFAVFSDIIDYGENKLNLNVQLNKIDGKWLIYSMEFN